VVRENARTDSSGPRWAAGGCLWRGRPARCGARARGADGRAHWAADHRRAERVPSWI